MAGWDAVASEMLRSDGPAALVCRQVLMPAEGHDAVIFPPTFAAPESGGKAGYNLDPLDPTAEKSAQVAIIDTVGSQANRMEPLFKSLGDDDTFPVSVVPQIWIKAGDRLVSLLDAGHRGADAIVRYSTIGAKLRDAFAAYGKDGDGRALAKIAPTSLVFGAWDSRDTQVKLPRLVASTIRAYDVVPLRRSAQYNPPIDYIALGLIEGADDKKVLDAASELGFRHAPAAGTHGGVIVRGEIRREAILSLVGLRAIGPRGPDGDALRRYILALALIAMIYDRPHDLRQGCLLVGDPDKPAVWELVANNGKRNAFTPDADAAKSFATAAAAAFGLGESGTYEFDRKAANDALGGQGSKKAARGKRKGGDEGSA